MKEDLKQMALVILIFGTLFLIADFFFADIINMLEKFFEEL